ncbi:hypothetical protein [Pyxidicoccus sp. MSG2]|uniref:hypothetical protein n=1 Tax=Pyxidicoccus sp. MSG2 TaxID=2996790 RepID=UPI00226F8F48|nr:hypothetical protein [Pyxidicoccus sp. MSG2]MCY1022716.1 hypothetical protein [Pyxidicoccus sp. MSG2]
MKTRYLLILVACLTACTTGPYQNTSVPNKSAPILFQGYASAAGAAITVAALNNSTGEQRTIATTVASSTAAVDSTGRSWYYWSTSVVLPRQGGFWQPDGASSSKASIITTIGNIQSYTFTAAQMTCTVQNLSAKGYAQAALDCGSTADPLVLLAPCDSKVTTVNAEMNGCYHVGTTANLEDFPFNRSYDLANGLQGVCHDDNNWFVTSAWRNLSGQQSRIAKKPVNVSFNEDNFLVYRSPYIDQGWRHPGDCDVYGGVVYVPLEPDEGFAGYNAIGRFNTSDLSYYPVMPIPVDSPQRARGDFPWMARNPKNNLWYSSKFNANELYVYAISGSSITYKGTVALPQTISRIQGGEFSPSGRLFLATDWNTGLVSLELGEGLGSTAAITQWHKINWVPGDEEIEGLTVWNLDDGRAPGIRGQVHVLMLDVGEVSNDDLYFKHMRVSPIDAL